MTASSTRSYHEPVMAAEAVELIAPRAGRLYCDGTTGGGGHARALLEASAPDGRLLALDRDPAAIEHLRASLASYGDRVTLVHGTFGSLAGELERAGLGPVDGLVVDLGVSSAQLDEPARGFSFRADGPLDMRMDTSAGETAAELLERLTVDELATVLRDLGEERHSRRVARAISRAAGRGELRTTTDLARAVRSGVGAATSGAIDAATRSFQAIRIAVNDELRELDALLALLPDVLSSGGRVVFIAFHSLEDRAVKQGLRRWSGCRCDRRAPACLCGGPLMKVLTRKPLRPSDEEVRRNPRARSARLRAAERLPMVEAA